MTDFRQDKAIYLQMYERICDGILSGRYGPGDRIPSVRELSEQLEAERARELILADRRREFMDERLPELFRQMRLLGIPMDIVEQKWKNSEENDNA